MGFAPTTSRSKRPVPVINVTPLIDVVLVLLIVFLVVAPLPEPAVDVSLPTIAPGEVAPEASESQIVLFLRRDGTVTLDEVPVSDAELSEDLAAMLRSRRDKLVFFQADPSARYGRAVEVMDLARAAGVETLGTVVGSHEGGRER
jgi:biopolymer transport protein ExbD